MSLKRVYISGPMTGVDDFNRPAFRAAAERLQAAGYAPICPADIVGADNWEWSDWMREALRWMLMADAVALLPGWRESRGAMVEFALCAELDIPCEPIECFFEG